MTLTYITLTIAFLEENHRYFFSSWKIYRDDSFKFWKCPWDNIYNLYNSLQNLNPKIKFPIENSFKELQFLDIILKTQMVKWSQAFATNPQKQKNTSISK